MILGVDKTGAGGEKNDWPNFSKMGPIWAIFKNFDKFLQLES